ncbi:MAG: hypothetical protein WBM50_12395 [Acidimicrobiales bacterium]
MTTTYGPIPAILCALLLFGAACGNSAETNEASAVGQDTPSADTTDDMTDETDETDGAMSSDMAMADGHSHEDGLAVPDGMAVPSIAIEAVPDSKSGHNLFIELEDFTITPENASTDPVDGEGHLHLYIDGERKARFYNRALYIDGLDPGDHGIEVEVSANNHAAYTVDGEPIRAGTTISVPESAADADGSGHSHDGALFESAEAPTIDVSITEDPKSGWNLFADVSNLTFAPEHVGSEPVDGEGHLHLYIDGEKVTRLYGPWWHIPSLEAGTHQIMVEVSGNDHAPYGSNGKAITAMATIEVDAAAGQAMTDGDDDHSESEGDDAGHNHDGDGETIGLAAADADVVIRASLANGEVAREDRRFQVPTGSTVGLLIESDVDEEIHVHGYDLLAPVGPGTSVDLSFLADSPGTFEVEFEKSGRFLFEIQVN